MTPRRQTPALGARPRPTLKQVAEASGVSTSTASLVFSGKGPVSEATRERVRETARSLGYRGPDPLASSLRRGRVGVVAVVLEDRLGYAFQDPYAISVLDGLAEELDRDDLGMLLISQSPLDPARAGERLAGTAFDALVFAGCGPPANPLVGPVRERGIPVVALGAPVGPDVTVVDIDNAAAMRVLAAHVHDLGHRDVGVVALPWPGAPTGTDTDDPSTLAAMLRGRSEEVIPPHSIDRLRAVAEVFGWDTPVEVATEGDVAAGAAATARLLDRAEPTAVLALSDLLAAGALRTAAERGLDVPTDLSITGFDGVALPWWPGTLTTIIQPGVEKGRAAGAAVRAALAGRPVPDEVLGFELRAGTSTAAPRRG